MGKNPYSSNALYCVIELAGGADKNPLHTEARPQGGGGGGGANVGYAQKAADQTRIRVQDDGIKKAW